MIDREDHRAVAQALDLLHFQDEAPGMVFWHPRGLLLYRILEESVRKQFIAQGYQEVRTPQILRKPIWESSGHWQHFYEGMFRVQEQSCEAAIKPVSCPGHVQIVGRMAPSYRDLPIRLAEFGIVHRDEQSGALHGLLRLRQFTQDDGHVFCTEEQASEEVEQFCKGIGKFYEGFGFGNLSVAFSTRPQQRAGQDEQWDRAESALEGVLGRLGWDYEKHQGEGAFYGPKFEFSLKDKMGRQWQCGTIQYDLVMPVSFDLRYVDSRGERRHAVMLHRAIYGSLERFMGILLEEHGLELPLWLAPQQVVILPIGEEHCEWARELKGKMRQVGLRVELDDSNETLSKRILEARNRGIPLIGVIGTREVQSKSITIRQGHRQETRGVEEALAQLADLVKGPSFEA
jgi:threonyl-tRNA synthetase